METVGIIGVQYQGSDKVYDYRIPDYIDPDKISKYVIVKSPYSEEFENYSIVKVIYVNTSTIRITTSSATKFIIDTIDDSKVVDKEALEKSITTVVDMAWKARSLKDKVMVVAALGWVKSDAYDKLLNEYNTYAKL
jgi:glycine betaine/choline ABC-type transport system substrate-binding protein